MQKGRNFKNAEYPADFSWYQIDGAVHTITVLCGIGETVAKVIKAARENSNTTERDRILANPVGATLDKIDFMVMNNVVVHAQRLKFNVMAIATYSQYTKEEILATRKFAFEKMGSKYFSTIVHSQGGYNQWGVMDEVLARVIDGSVWVAPGPGYNPKAAKFIADEKFSNWFLTSNLDTKTAGDLGQVTENWHKAILDAGGVSFMTLYRKTTVANEHSIFGGAISNPGQWEADGTTPKMSIFEFLLSNAQGYPVVAPDGVFKRVSEAIPSPVPQEPTTPPPAEEKPPIEPETPVDPTPEMPDDEEAPEPQPDSVFLKGAWANPDKQRGGDMVALFWSDGEKEQIRAEYGEQIVSVYSRLLVRTGNKMFKASVTLQKGEEKTEKHYGPYKK
jgi:hypothetical protein